MATAATSVVRESGKFGLLPSGKFAIRDASGVCADCCGACCGDGVACSVPDTAVDGPGPVVTWNIAHSLTHFHPESGGFGGTTSVDATGETELPRVDFDECVASEYGGAVHSDVVGSGSFPGDYHKIVNVKVWQNPPGGWDPGLLIQVEVSVYEYEISQLTYNLFVYVSAVAGRVPCVEFVESKITVTTGPPCIFPDLEDFKVPVLVGIENDGECPTVVRVSWGKAEGCTYFGEQYSYSVVGQVSIAVPWIRCNSEEELSDTCLGACCHDEGCEQTTKAGCDGLGGTFHPGQACDDAPCAECSPAGYRVVCGGAFGVAVWDGSEWELLPSLGGGIVQTLCVHNGELYAGGSFSGAVKRWECGSWVTVGDGLNSAVFRLKSINLPGLGQTLVAVGQFSGNVGSSTTIRRAGYLDPTTGLWLEYGDGFNQVVWDVSAHEGGGSIHADGGVWFAGAFTASGSGASSVSYLALDPGGARGAFVSPATPDDFTRSVFAIASSATTMIGGRFANVNSTARGRLAMLGWNGSAWALQGESGTFGPLAGDAYRVRIGSGRFYALGSLTSGGFAVPIFSHAGGGDSVPWVNISGSTNGRGHDCIVATDPGGGSKLWLAGDIAENITGNKKYVLAGDAPDGPLSLVGDGSIVNGPAHAMVAYTFPAPVPLGGTGSRPGLARGCGDCGKKLTGGGVEA